MKLYMHTNSLASDLKFKLCVNISLVSFLQACFCFLFENEGNIKLGYDNIFYILEVIIINGSHSLQKYLDG